MGMEFDEMSGGLATETGGAGFEENEGAEQQELGLFEEAEDAGQRDEWEEEDGNAETDEGKIELSIGGESRQLAKSEVEELLQEASGYEALEERLQQMPEMKVFDSYARASGMTREQYVAFLDKTQQEAAVQKMVQRGVPQDMAQKMQELEQREAQREQVQAATQEKRERQGFEELVREYPNVSSLPPQVITSIASGVPPLFAYKAFENGQLKAQMAAGKAAEKNKQRAPGGVSGGGNGTQADLFMSGFGT